MRMLQAFSMSPAIEISLLSLDDGGHRPRTFIRKNRPAWWQSATCFNSVIIRYRKGNAIDYMVNPPLIMPADARDNEVDFLPGGRSYIDNPGSGNQVQPAFNVALPLGDLREDIADVRNRINPAFNVDLFMMIANAGHGQMTATEVAERHEEKLMMFGPVLSRLNEEVLRPLIERCFDILARQGQLPPPPEELRGQKLSVEYTSMLARSQRAIRANSSRSVRQSCHAGGAGQSKYSAESQCVQPC